jgi:GDSL-like lipase/acylhydrolase family protein
VKRARDAIRVVSVVSALALAATACSSRSRSSAPPVTTAPGRPQTVLAIGGSATEGDGVDDRLRNAWPYLVFRESFPVSTVFVNGALDDATAEKAVVDQAPLANELKPGVVEIWLGADDLAVATPLPAFTLSFTRLIDTLKADGARRILVADLPGAYGERAAAYNAAIHAVVAGTHAELVSLSGVSITLAPTDGLAPQPDAGSHRLVATAFEAQLERAGS